MYIHTYILKSNVTKTINYFVVNGNWSEWRLGPCSKTCGGGIQNYARVCDNPKPSCEGKQCEGPTFYAHKQLCNIECCPGQMKCIEINCMVIIAYFPKSGHNLSQLLSLLLATYGSVLLIP